MDISNDDISVLAESREVSIVTEDDDGRLRRTVIWVAASDGELFVRSVRGDSGHWYRRARAKPMVALESDDVSRRFEAVHAPDDESVNAASEGFRAKYSGRSLDSMLAAEVLHTTLRLRPVEGNVRQGQD